MKKLFFLLLVLVLVFMASLSFADTQSWTKMKNFSIKTLSGEQFDLYKTLEEKELVLIDLWFIGCSGCANETYSMEQVYDEYKDRVGFISINPINKQQDVQDFITYRGLKVPCAANANCRSWADGDGYPTLILINKNHDVLHAEALDRNLYELRKLLDWGLNMTEEELQQYYSMEIPYLFPPGADINRKERNHLDNETQCLTSVYNLKNNMSLTVKCPGLRRIIVDENLKYLESSQFVGEFFLAPSDATHLTVTVHTDQGFNPSKANMFNFSFEKTSFREAKKNGNDYIFEIELTDDMPAKYAFYASDDYGVLNKDSYVGFYCFRSIEDAGWQFKDWEKQYDCEFPWHIEEFKSVSGMTLSDTDLVILQGKEVNLTAEIFPKDASDPSVEWISSDDTVATVQNGTIKAVSPGECDIICKSQDGSGTQATCHIQVSTAVKSIKINENPVTLLIGASEDLASSGLTYTVTPEDTYWKKVTWESSNEAIAVVDENGVVTGVGPGKAIITAWSIQPDSRVKAQAQVVVQQAVTGIELPEDELTISLGKSATIKPVILPADAANKKLEWSSSDESVAVVNNGTIKAVSCGECDIICKAADGSEISGKCHITVLQMVQSIQSKDKSITVPYGGTYAPEITIKPDDATNKTVLWTTSDENVCRIRDGGVVETIGAGDCEISCTSTDGSNKSAKILVHVPLFENASSEWNVDQPDWYLIPVDLHGFKPEDIQHSANSKKCFLYFFDSQGIHIYPIAAGTAQIMLSSKINKNDTSKYTINIKGNAVKPNEEGSALNAIVVIPNVYPYANEKPMADYYITGGKKPYTMAMITYQEALLYCIDVPQTHQFGAPNSVNLKSFPAGNATLSTYATGGIAGKAILTVVDADGNKATAYGNPICPINLGMSFVKNYWALPIGSTVHEQFRPEDGSGTYSCNAYWTESTEGAMKQKNSKVNSKDILEIEYTPNYCDALMYSCTVTDQKNKKLTLGTPETWIKMTDGIEGYITTEDSFYQKIGEEIEITVYCSADDITVDNASWDLISSDGKDDFFYVVDHREMAFEKIDEHTWATKFTVEDCEYVRFNMKLKDFYTVRKEFKVVK